MHRQGELSLNPAQIRSAFVYKLKDISLTILKGKSLVVIVKSATRSEIGHTRTYWKSLSFPRCRITDRG